MLRFALLVAVIGAVAGQGRLAVRTGDYRDIQIVRSELENDGLGTFSYNYETSDGTSAAQKGYLNPAAANEEPEQVVEGYYTYNSPEGIPIRIEYISNKYGFQPRGDALPTPPPTPEAILRSLELIKAAQNGRPAAPLFQAESRRPAPIRSPFQSQSRFPGSRF